MSLEETLRAIVREEIRAALADKQEAAWQGCITLAEAAKLASVSVSTLEKWGRQGLNIVRRGHVRRVEVAELRAFMHKRETTPEVDAKEWAKQTLASVTPMRRVR
jgi:hypothetical protein